MVDKVRGIGHLISQGAVTLRRDLVPSRLDLGERRGRVNQPLTWSTEQHLKGQAIGNSIDGAVFPQIPLNSSKVNFL